MVFRRPRQVSLTVRTGPYSAHPPWRIPVAPAAPARSHIPVDTYPPADESFAHLHAAGWSVGDARILTADGPRWLVSGTNGDENQPYCLLEKRCLGLPLRVPFPDRQAGITPHSLADGRLFNHIEDLRPRFPQRLWPQRDLPPRPTGNLKRYAARAGQTCLRWQHRGRPRTRPGRRRRRTCCEREWTSTPSAPGWVETGRGRCVRSRLAEVWFVRRWGGPTRAAIGRNGCLLRPKSLAWT